MAKFVIIITTPIKLCIRLLYAAPAWWPGLCKLWWYQ